MSEDEIINQALSILKSRLKQPNHFFKNPHEASAFLKLKLAQLEYESFNVMYLDNQNGLIELKEMFKGTVNAAHVHPREVVKMALHFNAAAIILSHNHPSGNTKPSQSDKDITNRLKSALDLIDVRVLDHIIVGRNESYSFAQNDFV